MRIVRAFSTNNLGLFIESFIQIVRIYFIIIIYHLSIYLSSIMRMKQNREFEFGL